MQKRCDHGIIEKLQVQILAQIVSLLDGVRGHEDDDNQENNEGEKDNL